MITLKPWSMPEYQNGLIIVIPLFSILLCSTLSILSREFFQHPLFKLHIAYSLIPSIRSLFSGFIFLIQLILPLHDHQDFKKSRNGIRVIANFKNSDKQIRLALVLISPPILLIHSQDCELKPLSFLSLSLTSFSSYTENKLQVTILRRKVFFLHAT